MKIINDERGLAVPLVLVIMVVLMLLGTALLQYSVSDALQVSRDEKRMQAYYIARSGADAVAEYIIDNPGEAQSLIEATDPAHNKFGTGLLGNGTFKVDIAGSIAGPVVIKSTGYFDNVEESVTLTLSRLTASDIFKNAIYTNSENELDITNMTVYGDVQAASDIIVPLKDEDDKDKNNKGNVFIGQDYPYQPMDLPEPVFPDNLASCGNLDKNNLPVSIDSDCEYGTIYIPNNEILVFNTGDKGNKLRIVVNELVMKGNICINGEGVLELYVKSKLDAQTPDNKDSDKINDNPNKLIIYLGKDSEFHIQANKEISAFIYGPEATIEVQSNQTTITGSIVARSVVGNKEDQRPNGKIVYSAPNNVDISSTIIGFKRGRWSD